MLFILLSIVQSSIASSLSVLPSLSITASEQEKGRIEVKYRIKFSSTGSVKIITCKKQTALSNMMKQRHKVEMESNNGE
ncbi:hypothetical protein Ccrd_014775 [Cynara cardunculus var. scolymus]|uniref:Uncharacterized protein n=1 Tax=Cynara cardunculus var. scolymus TaxID=59895 RepID=A0A103YD25_CYNCS|nr:hypothetical protein Ccrd_014775 [Cynara cardunculus var. scolymus]